MMTTQDSVLQAVCWDIFYRLEGTATACVANHRGRRMEAIKALRDQWPGLPLKTALILILGAEAYAADWTDLRVIEKVNQVVLPKIQKFIDKVESGKARSKETYSDMKEIRDFLSTLIAEGRHKQMAQD